VRAQTRSDSPCKAHILVVEDDKSSRLALMALLRMTGFDPFPAASVSEGIACLTEHMPHCLILDLMLPDGNGSTILSYIRERSLPIRVAVTTGAIEWEKMLQGSAGPPDVVFPKPVDFQRLIDWLTSHCHAQA